MRVLKFAATAVVLAAIPVSASANYYSGLWFRSLGQCEAQLKKISKVNAGGLSAASWDAAYCAPSGDRFVFVFPL